MIAQEILTAPSNKKLDKVLVQLCDMIVSDQTDSAHLSMVGAAVIDPDGNQILRRGKQISQEPEVWRHAEREAIDAYTEEYGSVPEDSIIVTTLSPCDAEEMQMRYKESCTELLEGLGISKVYTGYIDPSQDNNFSFDVVETSNPKLKELCEKIGQAVLHRDQEYLNTLP